MAVGPTKLNSLPDLIKTRSGNTAFKKNALSPQQRAQRSETEAARRIVESNRQVTRTQSDNAMKIDEIRDQFRNSSDLEEARQTEAYDKQRLKGEENINNLKRQQNRNIADTRRRAERALTGIENHFRSEQSRLQRDGERNIRELNNRIAQQDQHFNTREKFEKTLANEQYQRNSENLKEMHTERMTRLRNDFDIEFDTSKKVFQEGTDVSRKKYLEQYSKQIKETRDDFQRINADAVGQLNRLKTDTSRSLAAFSERQDDPFYQIVELETSTSIDDNEFIIEASIPTHEQGNISVSISGDQVIITGRRTSAESIDAGPGRTISTHSHQSYSETFPLPFPVEGKALIKEFDGDTMTIKIPRKGGYGESRRLDRARDQRIAKKAHPTRPIFPKNLPHVEGFESSDEFKVDTDFDPGENNPYS